MTIEEKAKAYDEALERAEKALEVLGTGKCEGARQIFSLFPELKESEDEKVRKEIVEYLKKNLRLEWATWLEKQGEQKPTWSEEDGKMINKLMAVVELYYVIDDDLDKQSCLSWLESFKQRIGG